MKRNGKKMEMTKKKVYIITDREKRAKKKKERKKEVKKIKRRSKERSIILFSNTANIL